MRGLVCRLQEQNVELRNAALRCQQDMRAAILKTKELIKEKKKQWIRSQHEATLKRIALNEFPAHFDETTLKMHKSNEKMYPMLDFTEKAIAEAVRTNMGNVGQAMHHLQDALKAKFGGQWNCLVWRSSCARTAVKFRSPYAQFTGPESIIITVWQV